MKKYILSILCLFLFVGCTTSPKPKEEPEVIKQETEKSNISIQFSEMNVSIVDGMLHVSGESKTEENKFYFMLEVEDTIVIEEKEVGLGHEGEEWRPFTLAKIIDVSEIDRDDTVILKIYAKDKERIVNPSFIPLELGYY